MRLNSIMKAGELRGKRVLVRLDLNVPLSHGKIEDEGGEKLHRALVTVKALVHRGAKVILMTHLGRPNGKRVPSLSTRPLATVLSAVLGQPVKHAPEVVGSKAIRMVKALKSREILMLENLRFEKGEEKNSPTFAKQLAELGDIYVNDAFAVSHRAHASTVGITKLLPSYAGVALIEEVQNLVRVVEEKPKRLVVVVGGAKISTKMEVLERFLKQGSRVLVGGAMATCFFKARGLEVGKSFYEKSDVELARKLLRHRSIVLPDDVVVTKRMKDGATLRMVPPTAVEADEMIVDVGLTGLCEFRAVIDQAATIVWNGPVGITEIPSFAHGSIMLARTIAKRTAFGAFSVAGGGDTLPVLAMSGMEREMSYVSTGGGAMLEFLSGKMLPGLIPLVN